MADKIKVGDLAPSFTLSDPAGKQVSLSDFTGKSNLVLFFYPRDESYGCTREACSFRDHYEDFKEAGTEVIGISADSAGSHQSFAARHRLPFILLSDPEGKVAQLYQVGKSLGILPGRTTFIIDKQGIIKMIFSSQLNFNRHVSEAREALRMC